METPTRSSLSPVSILDEAKPTTFMEALKRKDYTTFRELLKNNTPTEFDEEGNSVFATAVIRGELTPIQWLIDHYKRNKEAMSAQLHSANHQGLNALYQAARHGHNYTTDKLITLGSDPTIGCDDDGMTTPLWILENYSRNNTIKSHDSQEAADESNENHSPQTPRVTQSKVDAIKSQQAALKHVKRVLLMSLQKGIDPNQCRKSDGKSLLHMATEADAVEVVWILLAHGADRHATMKGNISVYDLAKSERMRHMLTLSDEDIASCSTTASTATMYKLSTTYLLGMNEAMRNLLADPNSHTTKRRSKKKAGEEKTPVILLPAHLQKDIDDLINDGPSTASNPDDDAPDEASEEVLDDTSADTDIPEPKYTAFTTKPSLPLVTLSTSLQQHTEDEPLTAAVIAGNQHQVQRLIHASHDATAYNHHKNTLLMLSSYHGWLSITQILLASQSVTPEHINQVNRYGCTALNLAIMKHKEKIVSELLQAGADPNIGHDGYGKPALLKATEEGNGAIVCHLLRHGANVDASDNWKVTALMVATERCKNDQSSYCYIIQELLSHGANVHQKNHHGNTALRLTQIPFIIWMLKDAHANRKNGQHTMSKILLRATADGELTIVNMLLNRRADVHAMNRWGTTALMIATLNNRKPKDKYWQIAERLVRQGAHVHQANYAGDTAVTLAKHDAMRQMLQTTGRQQHARWYPPRPEAAQYHGGYYHGGGPGY